MHMLQVLALAAHPWSQKQSLGQGRQDNSNYRPYQQISRDINPELAQGASAQQEKARFNHQYKAGDEPLPRCWIICNLYIHQACSALQPSEILNTR